MKIAALSEMLTLTLLTLTFSAALANFWQLSSVIFCQN